MFRRAGRPLHRRQRRLGSTFAALANAKVPAFVDGRSFAGLLHHPSGSGQWRTSYLVEHWKEADTGAVRGSATLNPPTSIKPPPRFPQARSARRASRAGQADRIPEYHGIRTGRYLYVEFVTGEHELYETSVIRDPAELHDISTAPPPRAVRARCRGQLARLKTCRAASCRVAENQPAPH